MITVNEVITPNEARLFELISGSLREGKITNNGELVNSFEALLKKSLGINHLLTSCNGTMALHMAFRSMGTRGEVITTPFSFIASASSLVWEGFTPVFCDIDPNTLCIDPQKIESLVNKNTVGISAVHVFGNPCDIKAIEAIAQKHGLFTVYDGAQAFGSEYDGKSCLSYGTLSALSLHAYKIVSSVEGGALICNDSELNERLFEIRYFGKNREDEEARLGTNAKMSELHAAYGILSLENYQNEQSVRNRMAGFYRSELEKMDQVQLQQASPNSKPNNSYFCVILPSKNKLNELVKFGKNHGVIFRQYFHPSLSKLSFLNASVTDTPIADDLADRVLCIPIHSKLTPDDLLHVVHCVKTCLDA